MAVSVSLKSLKSTRSILSSTSDDGKHIINFDEFISTSCKRFNCPISVTVGKEVQRDYIMKGAKKHESKSRFKRKSIVQHLPDIATPDDETKTDKSQPDDEEVLLVMTYYDFLNRLIEIQMSKYRYQPIPRILMKLIALIAPHNRQLNKFTIKNCKIDKYTIYELSKILPLTNITDVSLDHSPLREGNYDLLLREPSCIRNLSLSRCNINDIICERLAARLRFQEPAASTLVALNLSTNLITDVGAEHLGAALRSNRHLRYLNLAGNQLTDTGAFFIFKVLTEFLLTPEEIMDKRRRYVNYLNKRHELYYRCLYEFRMDDNGSFKKSLKRRTSVKNRPSMKRDKLRDASSDEGMKTKLELMVQDLLGPFEDPFCPATTRVIDRETYSKGNLVMCYLNLAYNNLSFVSIQKLLSIILYQQKIRTGSLCGLLNVVVDGNYLPEECKELDDINNTLLKHIICFSSRPMFEKATSKRKSTVIVATPDRKQPLSSG